MNTYKHSIIFIDTEIDFNSKKILDIGAVKANGETFHKNSIQEFKSFLNHTEFVCGHNIWGHDVKYIGNILVDAGINLENTIDTLLWSPLLFPAKPYHALVKDDKLQSEDTNNPLADSWKVKILLEDEIDAFNRLDETLKQIFYFLLKDKTEFKAFFTFIGYNSTNDNIKDLIDKKFENEICQYTDLNKIISDYPIEFAYSLSLLNVFIEQKKIYSVTPPWVLKNYPKVEQIMFQMRNKPCATGCAYCYRELDAHKALKKFFGFDSFRTYGGKPLQEQAVKAAVEQKSMLTVFPTGGGKSITFQLPALISGQTSRALTVVISPLQSLMKDQVDNLERNGITEAVTINGLLDPIERAKSFQRVEDGSACILYISPESLRSHSIEKLILGRKIARFVIDEAHCFSEWGQDFRVDYLYIGDFIKQIEEKKNLSIPVSCFTATAKQKVIEDIRNYFKEKLSLELELFTANASRTNLTYQVFQKNDDEEKYQTLRNLIEENNCPTIIYVSRTRKTHWLAEKLTKDGFTAKPYHGKMDTQEKIQNQDDFISGKVSIMVATSAFGMGVDKKDVGMVIHYEISDSLENYIQEAGRAGRDENITANCYVLFNEEDLDKHFILLNQTKISIKEIQQIWKAIKELTRFRTTVSNSALEIARKAGWDDTVKEIETRVTTAIAALEDVGYLKRKQNMPRVFANSILCKNIQEAIDKINVSQRFNDLEKEKAIRIMKKLFSSKNRKQRNEETPESRVDYISDHLGIVKEEVIKIINLLREEKILADAKDLTAFIKRKEAKNRSLNIVETFAQIEKSLLSLLEDQQEQIFYIKELNEKIEQNGCKDVTTSKIKTIINFWTIKNFIKKENLEHSKNHIAVLCRQPKEKLKEKTEKRITLAKFIVRYLYDKSNLAIKDEDKDKEEILVEFSIHELKEEYKKVGGLFNTDVTLDDIEDTLFYLSRIEALKIEGGFLVVYNKLIIERIEQDNHKKYTKDDYQKLNQFYENKVQQIHIVGEYAKKMITDYKEALQFVEDYFQLNYKVFLKKYFPSGKHDNLKRKMTPAKFERLFGELSPSQLKIVNDSENKYIVVAAGPGSGKTRVLVHKLASLLLMEDVKHEQLLMLTFSRAAATEFKQRLISLIGNAAGYVEIKTFHSYCFDLLGKVGSLEKSDSILEKTIEKINNREVEPSRITKTVLVIDEAQDINEQEYKLITTLMDFNEEMRVIAVGDDDQNIYEFRGSSTKYLKQFIEEKKAVKYELTENYRSKRNIVAFANDFVKTITDRLKTTPIIAKQIDNGKIKLINYKNDTFIVPLVQDILNTQPKGSTCVLTTTNEDALQIMGLLLKNKKPAKLIQTNDFFNLYNLLEIRFFLDQLNLKNGSPFISDEIWSKAKKELQNTMKNSTRLEIANNLIQSFEITYPVKKYKSDLETFIRESQIEDFFNQSNDTIFVSTIHKAKGKEFDNVFLMLPVKNNFFLEHNEFKRQLYVAMTRAKQNLTIHLNSNFLDTYTVENLEKIKENQFYPPLNQIIM